MTMVLGETPYGSHGTDAPLPRAGLEARRAAAKSHRKETDAVAKESVPPRHIRASSEREPKEPLEERLRVCKVNGLYLEANGRGWNAEDSLRFVSLLGTDSLTRSTNLTLSARYWPQLSSWVMCQPSESFSQ